VFGGMIAASGLGIFVIPGLYVVFQTLREKHGDRLPVLEATREAARLRLRPIVMTSFAFILGVVPLLTATGAGAASQRALGTVVFGGMLASTLLAIPFVPAFYVLMERFDAWRAKRKGVAQAPIEQATGTSS